MSCEAMNSMRLGRALAVPERIFATLLLVTWLATASAQSLAIPSGDYALDRTHAYVTFSYLHQGLSYPLLRATDVDGELWLDAAELSESRAMIAVRVDSIRSNTDYFDKELASPKFFNAGKFPHVTFATERYEPKDARSGLLHGHITVRGISKPMVLDVTINGAMEHPLSGKPVIGVSATGSLKRSDFQLDRFIPAVADEVQVAIEAEFVAGSNAGSAAAAALARESLRSMSSAGTRGR